MDNTQNAVGETVPLERLVRLKSRFATAISDMDDELTEANKKIAELESKLRIAEFENETVGDCGCCGEYKPRPWKDDDHGYVCVKCAVELAAANDGSEPQERRSRCLARKFRN